MMLSSTFAKKKKKKKIALHKLDVKSRIFNEPIIKLCLKKKTIPKDRHGLVWYYFNSLRINA